MAVRAEHVDSSWLARRRSGIELRHVEVARGIDGNAFGIRAARGQAGKVFDVASLPCRGSHRIEQRKGQEHGKNTAI